MWILMIPFCQGPQHTQQKSHQFVISLPATTNVCKPYETQHMTLINGQSSGDACLSNKFLLFGPVFVKNFRVF
jgi:hypothetical protein